MEKIVVRGTVISIELDYDKKERVSIRFEGDKALRERFNSSGYFSLTCPNQGWKLGDEVEIEVRPVTIEAPAEVQA